MRVVTLSYTGIAYTDSFYSAIEARGVSVVKGLWTCRWLLKNLRENDVFHLHWPSYSYASKGSYSRIILRFLRFLVLLCIVRYRTKHIWWTAHNLLPHDRSALPIIDVLARIIIIQLASRVFVHGAEADTANFLCNRFSATG